MVNMNIGNNLVALQYHEQALRMRELKLGGDHADVAATKDNMGLVFRQLNQLDMALKVRILPRAERKSCRGAGGAGLFWVLGCLGSRG